MNYGRFARSYQFISRPIFGKALVNAQQIALGNLPSPCQLLIAGGGDGEILRHMSGFKGTIDYVEISEKMIHVAKSKSPLSIHWHTEDIFDFNPSGKYDTIFLPFLLANFTTPQCVRLLNKISGMLKEDGQLIVVDFTENPNLIQSVLLQAMYTFFRWFGELEVNTLPAIENSVFQAGFSKLSTVKTFHGFIEASIYRKAEAHPFHS